MKGAAVFDFVADMDLETFARAYAMLPPTRSFIRIDYPDGDYIELSGFPNFDGDTMTLDDARVEARGNRYDRQEAD